MYHMWHLPESIKLVFQIGEHIVEFYLHFVFRLFTSQKGIIMVDYTLYALVCCALLLSLAINLISLFKFISRKYPNLLYKEN